MEFPEEFKERGWGWSISVVFLVKIESGDIKINNEAQAFDFFEVLPQEMIPEHKEFLKNLSF